MVKKRYKHLLQGEYELTNTSWSKLQNKYSLTKGRIYMVLKEKEGLEVCNTDKGKSMQEN